MNDQSNKPLSERDHPVILIVLFALIAYFPIFLKLDVLPLRIWDEARNAVSAYEMYNTGDLLVVHYEGEPDMWGVKPPVLLWMQTLLMHLIGPGELAVRLPAAMAALFTGWLIFWWCWKRLGRPWLGLLSCCVLYTSLGFINMHGARSGDHDTPVVLFMTWSLLKLYDWCEFGRRKDLLAFFIILALGALTKSVQALLFAPGILAYLLVRKRSVATLRSPSTYIGVGIFIFMVGAYYLSREAVNPGYLQAVWENELWGRYADTLEDHDRPWDHYIGLLIQRDLMHWYMWVPAGILLGLLQKDQRLRHWTLLLTFGFLGYLLVVSASQTKLDWYTAPMMPLVSGLVAVAMYTLLLLTLQLPGLQHLIRNTRVIPYLFLFLLFARPWTEIVRVNYKAREWEWQKEFYVLSHMLKDASRGKAELEANALVYDGHYAHLLFYVHLLREQGKHMELVALDQLRPGHKVITDQAHVQEQIAERYPHEVLLAHENVRIHRILDHEHQR